MIQRGRGTRRKIDASKANRKRRIALEVYDMEWYDNLHAYSKGKVHCSCPMCASKTNGTLNKSKGPVDGHKHSSRIPSTNGRYGKKNYKPSDKKKIDAMNEKEREEE